MALTLGTRLGPYEVTGQIGVGGMGEVYRARDTTLNRDVAIKVLLPAVANDPDRLARFGREAQVLASLNHPNIAAIYGLEESGDVRALVMELVEGLTIADMIAQAASLKPYASGLSLDEALPIARQIADALEAAHEQGIIHRDLKPANIKVRPDGTVKVLDFGLAKAIEQGGRDFSPAGAAGPEGPAYATTITTPAMTMQGVILGTAAYMSPEQAAGKPVDKRSDLWAFGVVLLEMLTGRRVFDGETVSHVLASVLKDEPDWTTLPANTPAPIRRLLRRCLEKDRKKRLADAADARLEIEDVLAMPVADRWPAGATTGPVRRLVPVATLSVLGGALAAAVATWALVRPSPPVLAPVTRSTITLPPAWPLALTFQGAARDFAVAPDGSFLVYRTGASGQGQLVVRRFDRLDASPLAGATRAVMPFVSPDSRWIGFVQEDLTLKKVAVSGGSPITLTRLPVWPRGASWVDDTTIIIGTNSPTTGLLRVPAGGGEPTVLTTPERTRGEVGHVLPSALPGGGAVLFTIGADQPENAQVAVLDLQTGQRTTLLRGGRDAQYAASGHLLYLGAGSLSAVRFDLATRAVVGDPVRVLDEVGTSPTGALNAVVTRAGALVYLPGGAGALTPRTLVWIDRQGHETAIPAPPRAYSSVRLAPDGTKAAVDIRDQENDIWEWDLARHVLTRLTSDPDVDLAPVWTPDSRRVVFASTRAGTYNLYARTVGDFAADLRLTTSPNTQVPNAVTPDGGFVISHEVRPQRGADLLRVPLDLSVGGRTAGAATTEGLVETPVDEFNGDVSPDGRFLAYESDESGRTEIYARPYPLVKRGRWQVSPSGGSMPAWTRGGKELVYLDGATHLTAVPIETTQLTFRVGTPTTLSTTVYATPVPWRTYDVSPDGQRFLMIKEGTGAPEAAAVPGFVVVQNWFEELKRLLPVK